MKSIFRPLFIGLILLRSVTSEAAQGGGYTQGGLLGQYFASQNFVGSPGFTRRDVRLDFGLNSLPPGGGGQRGDMAFRSVPSNHFGVQWTGQLIPRFTETYIFKTLAQDAFRLRLRPSGETTWATIIDQAAYSGLESSGTFSLVAGTSYDIEVVFSHGVGAWAVQLRWASPSTPDEVIDPLTDSGMNSPDWTSAFTDIIKGAARNSWQALNASGGVDYGSTQATDALGWPLGDGAYIFQESLNQGLDVDPLMRGRISFSFHGRAAVSVEGNVAGGILSSNYDISQNLTSGSFIATNKGSNVGVFVFKNAHRDSQPNGQTGISDLRLMRPAAPDSSTSYDPTNSLFTQQLLDAIGHFTVVRHIYVANQQRDWSERTLPSYFNQNVGAVSVPHYGVGSASDNGLSWEHKILLANETGRDIMISIPAVASGRSSEDNGSYLWKLANLFRYGSDGVEPYTSSVADPIYPPLNPNLRVYLELEDELWNTAYPWYVGWANINAVTAADADANNADFQAINFDNLSMAKDGSGNYQSIYTWRFRKTMLRLIQISDIFRTVFGDAAMMTHVRPLYEWQYANYNDTARMALNFVDHYFNNSDGLTHVPTPHPVNHWLWGGGGATYYGAVNGNGLTSLVADPSFGTPALAEPGYKAAPSGSLWVFSGTAGIARSGGNTADIPPPYFGSQMGFVTDHGSISIPITFPANFTSPVFGVSFRAVNRTKVGVAISDAENIRVYLDGTNDITARTFSQYNGYTPSAYDTDNPWLANNVPWTRSEYYYTHSFNVQPGSTHTITFRGFGDLANLTNTKQTVYLGEIRVTSVDRIFQDGMPGGGEATGQPVGQDLQNILNGEATWAKAFGLEQLSYEGGWSLGGDDGGSWVQLKAKYGDARTAEVQERFTDMFHRAGSAVNVLGTYAQWPSWSDYYAEQGLLDVGRYPIVGGVDDRASHLREEPNNGVIVPAILMPVTATITDQADTLGRITSAGGWINWNVIASRAGQYQITVSSANASGSAVLLVDNVPVSSGGLTETLFLTQGFHSMKVRSTSSATFQVQKISVTSVGAPPAPNLLSVIDGEGQVTVSWAPISGATYYQVRFGSTSSLYTQVMDAGSATSQTVTGLGSNQQYFFAVVAGNASGLSLPSAEKGVIALAAGETANLAIWEFDGAPGDDESASVSLATGRLTVSDLRRGAGLDPSESDWAATFRANRFGSEPGAGVGHVYGTTIADAIGLNQYYEFSFRPVPGQTLSLARLAFHSFFQNGVGGAGITYSTDGITFSDPIFAIGSPTDSSTPWVVDLTNAGRLQNTTSPITFRIFLFGLGAYEVSALGDSSGNGLVVTGSMVPLFPTVVSQPSSQVAVAGATVSFTVTAVGSGPLGYQWKFNESPIGGATSATLTLNNVTAASAGNYSVDVSNVVGTASSGAATLSINSPVTITQSPQSQIVDPGAMVSFTVTAAGSGPLGYQWKFNESPIGGATSATLTLNNVTAASAGNYSVVVSNVVGTVTSQAAVLTLSTIIEAPIIRSPEVTDHVFYFTVLAQSNRMCIVETSADAIKWSVLSTNVTQTGSFIFSDPIGAGGQSRFYRVHQ